MEEWFLGDSSNDRQSFVNTCIALEIDGTTATREIDGGKETVMSLPLVIGGQK
jgi:hypothetical protein